VKVLLWHVAGDEMRCRRVASKEIKIFDDIHGGRPLIFPIRYAFSKNLEKHDVHRAVAKKAATHQCWGIRKGGFCTYMYELPDALT